MLTVRAKGDAGQASAGAMATLRAATSECHRRLERRLDIKGRFGTRERYRSHLESMFGFQMPFERTMAGRLGTALKDFDSRRKSALLVDDLHALGASAEAIANVPTCDSLPELTCEAAALGGLYVFEGATLGGQSLLPLVERQLDVSPSAGARYLASYGVDVSCMWRRFAESVEEWCVDGARQAAATKAAIATFEALEEWLCGDRE